jgi:HD-like signal output (HDOD) protein
MEQTLRQALAAIKGVKLPELPEEVFQIEQEISSRFASTAKIAQIIEQNTTLSGEVLRLVNSPAMRMKTPSKTIREAVDKLGLINIRNLVVSSFLQRMFSGSQAYKDIMSHSVDVAFCMAELSEWVSGVSRDEAYMLGLFHNSGSLMLATKDKEGYEDVFHYGHSNPLGLIKLEEETYQTTHTALGVLLGKKWHLPVDMLSAIFLHHIENCSDINNEKVRALVAMIKISNALVSEVSLGAYRSEEMRNYELDRSEENTYELQSR